MDAATSFRQRFRSAVGIAGAVYLLLTACGLDAAPGAGELAGDRYPELVRPVRLSLPADVWHLIQPDDVALVKLRIDEDGRVIDWVPLRLPHHRIAGALEAALLSAEFTPPLVAGQPVVCDITATVPVGEAGVYGILSETSVEHIESRLSALGANFNEMSLSLPGQLDKPLRLVSEGLPMVVVNDDGSRLKGEVQVEFYIDARGRPRMVRPGEALHPALRHAAQVTVEGFRFNPPTRGGRPTVVKARMAIQFGGGGHGEGDGPA